MGQQSQQYAFFSDFSGKITAPMPIFCQKNVNSLKNTLLSCPYYVKKYLFFRKHDTLMFFLIKLKSPCWHANIWLRKRIFSQNQTILWAKKVDMMSFFPIFHEKNTALMPTFCHKNVYSLKELCSIASIL